jgi:hypothetical protein
MAGFPYSRRQSEHMKTEKQLFRITADGDVYRGRFEPYENLGHIGSILHPENRTNTAAQVRIWWNAQLASGQPIEEYVPPGDKIEESKGAVSERDRLNESPAAPKSRKATTPRIRISGAAIVVTSEIAGEVLSEFVEVW